MGVLVWCPDTQQRTEGLGNGAAAIFLHGHVKICNDVKTVMFITWYYIGWISTIVDTFAVFKVAKGEKALWRGNVWSLSALSPPWGDQSPATVLRAPGRLVLDRTWCFTAITTLGFSQGKCSSPKTRWAKRSTVGAWVGISRSMRSMNARGLSTAGLFRWSWVSIRCYGSTR